MTTVPRVKTVRVNLPGFGAVQLRLVQPRILREELNAKLNSIYSKLMGLYQAVLETPSQSGDTLTITVLPEVSVPYGAEAALLRILRDSSQDPALLICGIQPHRTEKLHELLGELKACGIALAIPKSLVPRQSYNGLLIAAKSRGRVKCYFQPKLRPSKFEDSADYPDLTSTPFDELYYFRDLRNTFGFACLTCSDLFSYASGATCRSINTLESVVIDKQLPLDFIFCPMYTTGSKKLPFLQSITRLFIDNEGERGRVCLCQVNAQSGSGGGESRLLTSHLTQNYFKPHAPVRPIDAPVVGYEFSGEDIVCFVELNHRLRHSNQLGIGPAESAYHIYQYSDDSKVLVQRSNGGNYVMPLGRHTELPLRSNRAVAMRLADEGHYDKAIEWLLMAKQESDTPDEISLEIEIAKQYRHMGKLVEAVQYYDLALTRVARIRPSNHDVELAKLRASFGLVITDVYFAKGNHEGALEQLNKLFHEYLEASGRIPPQLRVDYRCNMWRQIAEIQRICGNYQDSLSLYRKSSRGYPFYLIMERLFARLGIADCLRMTGEHAKARKEYETIERALKSSGNVRLAIRVLRGKIENAWAGKFLDDYPQYRKDLLACVEKSDVENYRWGAIYSLITLLSLAASNGEELEAEACLDRLRSITDGHCGSRLALEANHVQMYDLSLKLSFGRASFNTKVRQELKHVWREYNRMNVKWGLEQVANLIKFKTGIPTNCP